MAFPILSPKPSLYNFTSILEYVIEALVTDPSILLFYKERRWKVDKNQFQYTLVDS